MKKYFIIISIFFTVLLYSCSNNANKKTDNLPPTKKFTVAWSIYTGWQPWDYAYQSGIIKKWADKYKIEIEFQKMDYIPSVEAYTAGQADACVMTNMEALDIPCSSGVTSSAIIMGDYSNGNDAILVRDNIQLKDLCGKEIMLVELSVSHYMLSRALEQIGLSEKCIKLINTTDSDIAPAFISNKKVNGVITWNPLVMKIQKQKGITSIFNSSQIPGELMDLMVVNTKTLQQYPEFGKALTGAWYEVMDIMAVTEDSKLKKEAFEIMAESAGCSVEEYKQQLITTEMYYKPEEALSFYSGEVVGKMNYVRKFCFEHGLLGRKATSIDAIGIKYPNNIIQGDSNNIQLIFEDTYMNLALKKEL